MKYQKKSFRRKTNKKKAAKMSKKSVRKTYKKRTRSKKLQLVRPVPTGFSNSTTRLVYKPSYSKKLYQTLGPQCHFTNLGSGGQTSAINEQVTSVPYVIYSGSNIMGLANECMQRLDTNADNVTSAEVQTYNKSYKLYIDKVVSQTTYTNAAATNVEIEIYDLVAKTTAQTYTSPDSDWNQAITDEAVLLASGNNLNTPYCTPTNFKRFNMNWSVVKRTKCLLVLGVLINMCLRLSLKELLILNMLICMLKLEV